MEESPVQPSSVQDELVSQQPVDSPPPEKPPRLTKRVKILIAIVLTIIILLIAGVAGAYRYSGSSQAPARENESEKPPAPNSTTDSTADWKTYTGNGFSVKYDPTWTANADNDFGITSIMDISSIIETTNSSGQTISGPTRSFTVQVLESSDTPEEYSQANSSSWDFIELKNNYINQNSVIYENTSQDSDGFNIIISNGSNIAIINVPTNDPLNDQIYFNMLSTFKFTDQNSAIDTSDWKTYESEFAGFSFKYPSGWEDIDNDKDNTTPEYTEIRSHDYTESDELGAFPPITSGSKLIVRNEENSNFNSYEEIKDFILNKSTGHIQRADENVTEKNIGGVKCLYSENVFKFNEYNSSCAMYNNGKTIDLNIYSVSENNEVFNQILSTFKFTD